MNHYPNQGPRRSGKVMAGMVLLAVGIILLLKNFGYFFPVWLFSWPMLLIALGLFVGFKNNFQRPGGVILILIGAVFLAKKYFYIEIMWEYVWPVLIIIVGLWMIFGRNPRRHAGPYQTPDTPDGASGISGASYPNPEAIPFENANPYDTVSTEQEDYLDATSVFGGTKKMVLSKNFKGGEVVTIMGGAEINLSQADIQGRAVLEVTQIMGGTKIIVPANWDVKSEMAAVLGGIDDKRMVQASGVNPNKVLIIKGTSILGGIDIHNY